MDTNKNLTAEEAQVLGYEIIREALENWAFDQKGNTNFLYYTEGVVSMTESIVEKLKK